VASRDHAGFEGSIERKIDVLVPFEPSSRAIGQARQAFAEAGKGSQDGRPDGRARQHDHGARYEPDTTPGAAKKKPMGKGNFAIGKFADLKSFMPTRTAKAK